MTLRLEDIERLHLALLAVAGGIAFLTAWVSGWSLLLGGTVMGANFYVLRQLARRLLTPQQHRPWVVPLLMLVKFSLFLGLLGLLFWRVPLDPAAFGIGATLLLVACVAAAVRVQIATP
jgi:uncharacterized membrane-anchored protein